MNDGEWITITYHSTCSCCEGELKIGSRVWSSVVTLCRSCAELLGIEYEWSEQDIADEKGCRLYHWHNN